MTAIGLDIGTTKIAAVLLDITANRVRKELTTENDTFIKSHNIWEKVQNPQKIIEKSLSLISDLKKTAECEISCIGISCQMHGFVYIDRDGMARSPLYTWQDERGALKVGRNGETSQDLILQKTGIHVYPGYALSTHYYNTLTGDAPGQGVKIVSIGAYFGMVICSEYEATIDPSEASSFGLFDAVNRTFYLEDIRRIWGNTDFLPRTVPFHHCMGKDRDGIPVFQSLGDNQASFYGAMADRDEKVLVNLGTGGQISLLLDNIPSSLKGLELRPYPGKNLVVGSTLSGGKSFEIAVRFFKDVCTFFGLNLTMDDLYKIIDSNEIPDREDSLLIEPYFYGTRLDPELRGSIHNINSENLTAGSILSSVCRAIAVELRDLVVNNNLHEYVSTGKIVGSGNGLRKNKLICRMVEEVFRSELSISTLKEEAACGAALYAKKSLDLMQQDSSV